MKTSQIICKITLALFATFLVCLFIPQQVFSQTEKLGIITYATPKGMTKTSNVENVVAFSEFNQATGKFCLITLYGAAPSNETPSNNFTKEWKNLVVATFKAEANPKTETTNADGWTIIAGGAETNSEVGKAAAFLTVISGFGKTISILAVFNNPNYINQIDAFISAIDLEKSVSESNANVEQKLTLDRYGNVFIPPPTAQLTVADLAGEWGEESGLISTTYVNRSDGSYAGTDHLAYRSKMSITANGGYKNDFFAIRNGKKEIDKTTGTISIVGSTIFIKQKGLTKYVIRGWLELPNMTILKVCGPWFDNQEIPAEIFSNPEQGANLNKNWVRKK